MASLDNNEYFVSHVLHLDSCFDYGITEVVFNDQCEQSATQRTIKLTVH